MSPDRPLKAFVSYKWEGEETRKWVEQFARDLRRNGVNALLEVWEVDYGDSFIKYMTRNIPDADVFFFIMTPDSIRAVEAEEGKGGAISFEVEIATSRKIGGEKLRFIPILLRGDKPASFLRWARYVDFRDPSKYESTITDLLASLTGVSQRPPLLGSGFLEYTFRLYKLLPAEMGDPMRSIMAKTEPFVGFPFYSFASDHPSQWPPRVYEDRAVFGSKILNFIRNGVYRDRVREALASNETKIQSLTTAPEDAEEQQESLAIQSYSKLRMIFNFDLEENALRLEEFIGKQAADDFLNLEKTRQAEDQRMPNRLLKIAFRHNQGLELRNIALDIEIIGTVYDALINNQRPLERAGIQNMTTKRTVLNTGRVPGNVTNLIRIWYHYISLGERWDPKPIHFKAEPTQGIIANQFAAEGIDSVVRPDLIQDEGVYSECVIDPSTKFLVERQ